VHRGGGTEPAGQGPPVGRAQGRLVGRVDPYRALASPVDLERHEPAADARLRHEPRPDPRARAQPPHAARVPALAPRQPGPRERRRVPVVPPRVADRPVAERGARHRHPRGDGPHPRAGDEELPRRGRGARRGARGLPAHFPRGARQARRPVEGVCDDPQHREGAGPARRVPQGHGVGPHLVRPLPSLALPSLSLCSC